MPLKQDVVFRGSKDGLQIILNGVQDLGVLKEKLRDHLKRAESFFQVSDVILDTGDTVLPLDEILDIQNILAYPYGLRLKKIIHSEEPPKDRSRDKRDSTRPALAAPVAASQAAAGLTGAPPGAVAAPRAPSTQRARAERPAYAGRAAQPTTLLHKGTLRSGQRIDHDGNVVVIGDLNPGAEVKATGDIIVMGALRGLAHAGAAGGSGVVVALRLEPTQIRIGDVIGRPPEGDAKPGREPEVAKLRDGMILIEPLEGTRWEGER